MERLEQALEAARPSSFTPAELNALVAKTKEAALAGTFEPFKTTAVFDGTAQHPEWLG